MEAPSPIPPRDLEWRKTKEMKKIKVSATPATTAIAYRQHTMKFNVGLQDCFDSFIIYLSHTKKSKKVGDAFLITFTGQDCQQKDEPGDSANT